MSSSAASIESTNQSKDTPKPTNGKAHYGATPEEWSWFAEDDGLGLGLGEHLIPITADPNRHHPAIPPRSRGKVPSTYERGCVKLMDAWQLSHATAEDIARWSRDQDLSFGVQCSRLRAFDVDITDPELALEVQKTITETLGFVLPKRGRADSSKFLFAFTCPGTVARNVLQINPEQKIELLGDGQQFVVAGTHTNGFRYEWTPLYPSLFPLSSEQLESVCSVLERKFGNWNNQSKGSARPRLDKLATAIETDPIVIFLREKGFVISDDGEGKFIITCPFADQHTTGGDEAAYFAHHTKGYERGHFKCFHGHGQTQTDADYLAAIGYASDKITREDFWCYLPAPNQYIFVPTTAMWPAASVNARLPAIQLTPASDATADSEQIDYPAEAKIAAPTEDSDPIMGKLTAEVERMGATIDKLAAPKQREKRTQMSASEWIRRNRRVEQMVWTPGEPQVIADRLASDGGWIPRTGTTCFNLYRPPNLVHGDAHHACPWIDLVRRVFGDDAAHIIRWLAHRVQCPGEKINHALLLGGSQGIGKDTILEPVKQAVGPWNFAEESPMSLLGQFNPYIKSVILRVSEARDLGESNRFAFYDHMKTYTAAPPDVLRCNEKHLRPYTVFNVTGVIITSNHKIDGIHLPADDRRHFVAWSELTKDDFEPNYWIGLWEWYRNGGIGHVAAYLQGLDLSSFDPKAPPIQTAAFWAIVDANRTPEDAELADTIDRLKNPPALTLRNLEDGAAEFELRAWLGDRKNRRIVPHRLESVGYVSVRNEDAKDGLWSLGGRRQSVYGRKALSKEERIAAARALSDTDNSRPTAKAATDFDGDDQIGVNH